MSDLRQPKRLADYQIPAFVIEQTRLRIELHPTATRVQSELVFRRQSAGPLWLDGQALTLISIQLNGQPLQQTEYQLNDKGLMITDPGASGSLQLVTEINPEQNTALEGLYLAEGVYCTQCEAEGFRRITYYPDRPDVLSVFTTTLVADTAQLPFLLSNGNKVATELLADGRTAVTWHDPFPKPSYLFALVAGDFDRLADRFTTAGGREVELEFFVEKGKGSRAGFALSSLKRAMRWDEQRFGLEYDLDRYMVVAVDFFNMGAMENKGLNIFNSKYVLADDVTATDRDYFNIESIIGHEYFHNWTGNRVTCRDWFQLSLKEGLTVFRDQEFSADMASATLTRIDAVKLIRTAQFAEDASPMAHPIRPPQVLEMNNFYTVTVYDKGAEVIRMLQTLLGRDGFTAGHSLYLQRHDGQAVTCDDFVQAMQDATGQDLTQFRRWYSQSGTPELTVASHYDPDKQQLRLQLRQHTAATADQMSKLPLVIPVKIEILQPATGRRQQQLLVLSAESGEFLFNDIADSPLIVWLEDFSAPVKLHCQYSAGQWLSIAELASNDFARWDAMQQYWSQLLQQAIAAAELPTLSPALLALYRRWLQQPLADLALTAELLQLPDFDSLAEQYQQIPVEALVQALDSLQQQLATALYEDWLACYQRLTLTPYVYEQTQVGCRALRNLCLSYLVHGAAGAALMQQQYHSADNMTDRLAALRCGQLAGVAETAALLKDFAARFADDVQVLDKYFNLVVSSPKAQVFAAMVQLTEHPAFSWKNPNRVRAVYGAFSQRNPAQFHRADGEGYRLLADVVGRLDQVNPQLAARLITPLLSWQRYDQQRQQILIALLQQLAKRSDLSDDLYEKVSRSLV
ncbi:aminopeptidase N [Alishewanella aestuarii B11]|uniref:Aminopeptidase N n=1 Tax=Alishewanella aestuarii B11 TaxID=1197174 RepID=J2IF65_9ALTE|nr:aminopeptidase N [Alishewanella aestuarii]EJI85334.1 aminopeptidase N [Alishewanella aestuarii B11]